MLCPSACIALALLSADTIPAPHPGVSLAAEAAVAADAVAPSAPVLAYSGPPPLAPALQPSLSAASVRLAPSAPAVADTVPERSVEYSDAYFTRLTIHKYASYAMIPMFVAQYVAGEQLMDKGDDAPGWARDTHGALAAGVAGLFAVNTVTGGWNLWEGRHDPEGRTRRLLHGGLMLLADAGFAATGVLAEDAEEDSGRRDLHRDVALGSMAVSLLSYAIMLPFFGNR